MNSLVRPLDTTDVRLLAALRTTLRPTHAELARDVGIARGTVYSRLDRLEAEGVVTGYGPHVDLPRSGFGVLAFTTLEISQGTHDATIDALSRIIEIVEIHTVTGKGDLLCRIVARSNDHLHEVLQQITALGSVERSESQLALATRHVRSPLDVLVDGRSGARRSGR